MAKQKQSPREDGHKIAIAYYRYSSHKQGDKSIEGQKLEAERWAAENRYTIVKEYADRGISGRTDDRAGFQLMLKEISKIKPDYLVCWKVDRIGRNREEIAINKVKIKQSGAKIIYLDEKLPDTPESVLVESMLEGFAEYNSIQMSHNIKRGLLNSATKCQFIGGHRMYGYVSGQDKKYVVDQERAAIVREIFSRYVAGESQSQIITGLNERGIRTLKDRPFTPNSIRTLLKNEKYTGVYIFNGGEVRIEGGIPAIIDHETWENAQRLMIKNQRSPAHREEKENYILTDKLFCGSCGGPMSGISGTSRNGAKHYYYTCAYRHRKSGGNGCKKQNIKKDWIEGQVLGLIKQILSNDDLLEQIADRCYESYVADKKDSTYVDALKANLRDVENALNNIMRAIEAGIFNETTRDRMKELEEQRHQIIDEIEYTKATNRLILSRGQILYCLHKYAELDVNDPKQQQQLIDTFVNSIFAYDDRITITFNYSGDGSRVTLKEIDAAYEGDIVDDVFALPALLSTKQKRHPKGCLFLFGVKWREKRCAVRPLVGAKSAYLRFRLAAKTALAPLLLLLIWLH